MPVTHALVAGNPQTPRVTNTDWNAAHSVALLPADFTTATGTPSTTTFYRGDNTWATPAAGSPGGISTNIQYNSGGSFAGFGSWNGTTLGLGGTGNASAALDITSTTQGLGLPLMTAAQMNAISSPKIGLVVCVSDLGNVPYSYNGTWGPLRIPYTSASFFTPASLDFQEEGTFGTSKITLTAPTVSFSNATTTLNTNTGTMLVGSGSQVYDTTITGIGTTGAQTINKPTGAVTFAAAATSLVVTNSLVTANSIVIATIRTNDATAVIKNVIPAAGSFTINLSAAATAATSVGFFVIG